MKIEFLEDDALLQSDGIARHIIVSVEGKRMIVPTDKTIVDLCGIIKKMGKVYTPQPIVPTAPQSDAISPIVDVNAIQRNDYVKYIGKDDPDNPDLKHGEEYRVMVAHDDTLEIVSDTAPIAIRLKVLRQDAILTRKSTLKPIEQVRVFEQIINCDFCKTENVLQLNEVENKYKGICSFCHKPLEVERKV